MRYSSRKTFLYSLVVLVVACQNFLAGSTHAGSTPPKLVVTGSTVLHSSYTYVLSGIEVEPQATLVIEPGVTVELTEAAQVTINGALEVQGNALQPVQFISQGNTFWDQFSCAESSLCNLEYVDFGHFTHPVAITTPHFKLVGVTLDDGLDNRISIGGPGYSLSTISVSQLLFRNLHLGPAMKSSGLSIEGTVSDVTIKQITIEDAREPNVFPWQNSGLLVKGSFRSVLVESFTVPYQCRTIPVDGVPGAFFHVISDSKGCAAKRLPVVFVPGYATSLNMNVLAKPPGEMTDTQGWRFLASLTPAYSDFLADLQANAIPYEIAYYDWRLPAKDAAERYIKPAIERAKTAYGVDSVNLVAHSFGGIVSRSYLEGDTYGNDVHNFIELGTPNLGVVQAYQIWEGGLLPDDWQAMYQLIRFYKYAYKSLNLNDLEVVHTFFPSIQELLPIFPSLFRNNAAVAPPQNLTLQWLSENITRLVSRTIPLVIGSKSQLTPVGLTIDYPLLSLYPYWSYGKTIGEPILAQRGDGTVPADSVFVPGLSQYEVQGEHSELPAIASEKIIAVLYPKLEYLPAEKGLHKAITDILSFLFDCPITATVTSPDGSVHVVSSAELSTTEDAISSGDVLWLNVPKLPGNYQINILALQDTHVRGWVNHESMHEVDLLKGETSSWEYDVINPVEATLPGGADPSHTVVTSQPTDTPIISSQLETRQPNSRTSTKPLYTRKAVTVPNQASQGEIVQPTLIPRFVQEKTSLHIVKVGKDRKVLYSLLLVCAMVLLIRVSLYWKSSKSPP